MIVNLANSATRNMLLKGSQQASNYADFWRLVLVVNSVNPKAIMEFRRFSFDPIQNKVVSETKLNVNYTKLDPVAPRDLDTNFPHSIDGGTLLRVNLGHKIPKQNHFKGPGHSLPGQTQGISIGSSTRLHPNLHRIQ